MSYYTHSGLAVTISSPSYPIWFRPVLTRSTGSPLRNVVVVKWVAKLWFNVDGCSILISPPCHTWQKKKDICTVLLHRIYFIGGSCLFVCIQPPVLKQGECYNTIQQPDNKIWAFWKLVSQKVWDDVVQQKLYFFADFWSIFVHHVFYIFHVITRSPK